MQIILGKIEYQEIGVWTVPKNNNKETKIIKIQNKISHDRLSNWLIKMKVYKRMISNPKRLPNWISLK